MGILKKLYDFRNLELPEQLFRLSCSEEEVEKSLEDVRTRFLTIEETTEQVQTGDFVVIDLPESEGEEARRVQINVGKNFYDAAFEESLIGIVPGTIVTMPGRDRKRTGTLIQIKRRILPELNDLLITRMGIEGVESMDAYREYQRRRFIDQDKKKKKNALWSMVLREVVSRSEFGDMTEETEEALQSLISQYRAFAEQKGISYEECLASQIPSKYGTTQQREAYLRGQAEDQARQSLIARYYMEQSGRQPSREGYEAEKQKYLDMGMDRAQLEARFTYEFYADSFPFQIFQDIVFDYCENQFKEMTKK